MLLMKTEIIKEIRELIARSGLKQKAFAEQNGYKPNEFSNMMNARKVITAEDVLTIASGLHVTPDVLFGIKPYEIIVKDSEDGVIADITDQDSIIATGYKVQRVIANYTGFLTDESKDLSVRKEHINEDTDY